MAFPRDKPLPCPAADGFALVVTITMMALVTVLVLALLALAQGARSGTQSVRDRIEAQSSARLALRMAIGQLQRELGPDQRISTEADQMAAGDPGLTSAAPARAHWTGVYDSWSSQREERPEPKFRAWLVSGERAALADRKTAQGTTPVGTPSPGRPGEIQVVGPASAGTGPSQSVSVPLVPAGGNASVGWWAGDENIKAMVLEPGGTPDESMAGVRARRMGAPRRALELATVGESKPFKSVTPRDDRTKNLLDWPQAALLAEPSAAAPALFHDLSTCASGLLTNVRKGGFRKDLSFYLEKTAAERPKSPLYSAGGRNGLTEAELWTYYNLWNNLKTSGGPAYTTGGGVGGSAPYLQIESGQDALKLDPAYVYKLPTFIRCQVVMSLFSKFQRTENNVSIYRLYIALDPVVTIWNPMDVPLAISPAWFSVKFWMLPYDFVIKMGAKEERMAFNDIIAASAGWHYMTLRLGSLEPLVLKPGEVLLYSQGPNTQTQVYTPRLNFIDGRPGWNLGGGLAFAFQKGGVYFDGPGEQTFTCEVQPNAVISSGTRHWSLTQFGLYYKEDRSTGTTNPPNGSTESVGLGNLAIDWVYGPPYSYSNPKPDNLRLHATDNPAFFGRIRPAEIRPYSLLQLAADSGGGKAPFGLYSYAVKTESTTERPGRCFARLNPRAISNDFSTLAADELDMLPYEIQIRPLNSWKDPMIDVSTAGGGFFGGGYSAGTGVGTMVTHSVPREPVTSLAAFQHCAGVGYSDVSIDEREKNEGGYATVNAGFGTLPHVFHAIGNSMACSAIPPNAVTGSLSGGRTLLDHSYLANKVLFDDWFLSGIAPQTAPGFAAKRPQRQVAEDFFRAGKALPNANYRPQLGAEDAATLVAMLMGKSGASSDAVARVAAYLSVQGMFNVNSTSIEAWRTLLGGLKGQSLVAQGTDARDKLVVSTGRTCVTDLLTPIDAPIEASSLGDARDPAQWMGHRSITDEDIGTLARAIVKEVRRRGPFLSLADFVNRRVGNDKDLARSGAIQAALDSPEATINREFNQGIRANTEGQIGGATRSIAFPEAEAGPASYGIPGCVKQADILTPIAPVLSARSDTFRLRAYGEKTGPAGRVLSRAWCEAVVERLSDYVDPSDMAYEGDSELGRVNQWFGRKFRIVSFRWLSPEEV